MRTYYRNSINCCQCRRSKIAVSPQRIVQTSVSDPTRYVGSGSGTAGNSSCGRTIGTHTDCSPALCAPRTSSGWLFPTCSVRSALVERSVSTASKDSRAGLPATVRLGSQMTVASNVSVIPNSLSFVVCVSRFSFVMSPPCSVRERTRGPLWHLDGTLQRLDRTGRRPLLRVLR